MATLEDDMTLYFNKKGKQVKRPNRYRLKQFVDGAFKAWRLFEKVDDDVGAGWWWEWIGSCKTEQTGRQAIALIARDRRAE